MTVVVARSSEISVYFSVCLNSAAVQTVRKVEVKHLRNIEALFFITLQSFRVFFLFCFVFFWSTSSEHRSTGTNPNSSHPCCQILQFYQLRSVFIRMIIQQPCWWLQSDSCSAHLWRLKASSLLHAVMQDIHISGGFPSAFQLFPLLFSPRWRRINLQMNHNNSKALKFSASGKYRQQKKKKRYRDKSQRIPPPVPFWAAEPALSDVGWALTRLQRLQGPQSLRTQSSGQGSRLSLAPSGISSGSQR